MKPFFRALVFYWTPLFTLSYLVFSLQISAIILIFMEGGMRLSDFNRLHGGPPKDMHAHILIPRTCEYYLTW